jgi:peptidoglycan hydrolase-like protein with peptidoglycan-binding domain
MDARSFVGIGAMVASLLAAAPAAAPAAQAQPRLALSLAGASRVDGRTVALSGDRVAIRVTVTQAAPGSRLEIRVRRTGGDDVPVVDRGLLPGANRVRAAIAVSGPAALAVRARIVDGNGELQAWTPSRRLSVIRPAARSGDSGLRVRFLQRRLATLRYAVSVTGRYDFATANAVIAFRKVNRMPRTPDASRAVFRRIARGRGAFRPRRRGAAHVEGDLTRQVLALVGRGGAVYRVYTTSSGRPGLRTPSGVHRFWRKSAGWNSSGMLDSAYFTHASGPRTDCAIHGYFVVPTWNASHCCFRVPIPDARHIFDWVRIGQRIHVYY